MLFKNIESFEDTLTIFIRIIIDIDNLEITVISPRRHDTFVYG